MPHSKPGSHEGQVKASARKRRNKEQRRLALQAEADKLGLTIGELRGEQGLRYTALMADLAHRQQVLAADYSRQSRYRVSMW